jgi:hypothetical protein
MTKLEQIEKLKEELFETNVYSLEYVALLDKIIVMQYEYNSDENCSYYYKSLPETKHKARCRNDESYNEAFGGKEVYNYCGYAI